MRSLILTSCVAMWSPRIVGVAGRDATMADTGSVRQTAVRPTGRASGELPRGPHGGTRPKERTRRTRPEWPGGGRAAPESPRSHFPYGVPRKDTSVSSLWTPSGEHPTGGGSQGGGPGGPGGGGNGPGRDVAGDDVPLSPEELEEVEAEMLQARAQLAAVPVVDIIANHAVGL